MTKRPHDALFKSAFETPADAAALLRALLPDAIRTAVVWKTLRRESGSFIGARLTDRHSDLLFSARLQTGKPARVYFLIEHQSTDDSTMPLRMLTYQTRVWRRFLKEHPRARLAPVIAVLVSHVPGGWRAARAFEKLFDPAVMAIAGLAALVPRCSTIVEDLTRLSNDDLAARALGAFPKLALWLLRDARDPARLLASFDAWIPAMLEIGRTRPGRDNLEVLITYMFQVIGPMNLEELHAKLCELGPRTEKVAMTIAEYLRKEGRKEGRVDALRSLLIFKFQTLGAEYEGRLKAATPEAIDRYFQRLLTADSIAEVFEDTQPDQSSKRTNRGRRTPGRPVR